MADWGNDRVMRWCEGTIVVGGNGEGEQVHKLNGPTGLSFDGEGNLYVAGCLKRQKSVNEGNKRSNNDHLFL